MKGKHIPYVNCKITRAGLTADQKAALIKGAAQLRLFMTVSASVLLLSGTVLAGSEYDKCIKEENSLRAEDSSNCSGSSYIFNPSGCFATRKALKKYTSTGKCKKIGSDQQVDFIPPPVTPAAKPVSVVKIGTVNPVDVKKSELTAPQQETTYEQLKDENQRLKAELLRLRTENEQLKLFQPNVK